MTLQLVAQVAHHACLEMADPSLKFQALRAELRQERQEAQEVQELAIWGGISGDGSQGFKRIIGGFLELGKIFDGISRVANFSIWDWRMAVGQFFSKQKLMIISNFFLHLSSKTCVMIISFWWN